MATPPKRQVNDAKLNEVLSTRALDTLATPDYHEIPEHFFVKIFLPIFVAASTDEGVDIGRWLEVAGNAMASVKVMRGKEHLFTVPPLLRPIDFTRSENRHESMFEVVTRAEQKGAVNPEIGTHYLNHMMRGRVKFKPLDIEDLRVWNDIRVRYGYPPIEVPGIVADRLAQKPVEKLPPIEYEGF